MHKLLRNLRDMMTDRSGVAALEMMLSVPLLLAVLLGGVEVTRYILVTQKLEKVAVTLSDVATQSESITISQLDQIIFAAGQVMQPYPFGDNGYVIISSVTKSGSSNPVVNWQYKGGGTWTQQSQVGITGTAASLPAGFTMDNQENVIISEVYYNFQPMFGSNIFPTNFTIYKTGFFRPRLGSLTTLSKLLLKPQGAVL
jgi:Flp pilus assembly protein TadG